MIGELDCNEWFAMGLLAKCRDCDSWNRSLHVLQMISHTKEILHYKLGCPIIEET